MDHDKLPLVSVIIPCRNELLHIGKCLDSVLDSNYPKEKIEIFIIDGQSNDGTLEIIDTYIAKHPFIKVIQDDKKIISAALNRGIQQASGDIILRIDAHSTVDRDYMVKCIEYLYEYKADIVGGNMVTLARDDGIISKCITTSLSHRFGVGNSYFRISTSKPRWVTTVFNACYRRDVFDRFGLFNEKAFRMEDIELTLRLKKGGGKILLVSEVQTYYYSRTNFSFVKHVWYDGKCATLSLQDNNLQAVMTLKHLVPLLFVLSLITSSGLALVWPLAQLIPVGIMGLYLTACLLASGQIAVSKKNPIYFFFMPTIFFTLHCGYGLGSLWGLVKVASTKIGHLSSSLRHRFAR